MAGACHLFFGTAAFAPDIKGIADYCREKYENKEGGCEKQKSRKLSV